jgi:hypothetical protein
VGFGGIGSINNVTWYAPAVGQFVKRELQQRASIGAAAGADGQLVVNNQQYEGWELLEYKPN